MMETIIDDYLNDYASLEIADGRRFQWWWSGCDVLADAIASLVRHVRVDGCHALTDAERAELETLERYMAEFPDEYVWPHREDLSTDDLTWLHAEAMWLLGQWFARLWD